MSKRAFVYCESTEGGMDTIAYGDEPPKDLRGWMSKDCKAEDEKLLAWMEKATPGQWTEHRLGSMFCVSEVQIDELIEEPTPQDINELIDLCHKHKINRGVNGQGLYSKNYVPLANGNDEWEMRYWLPLRLNGSYDIDMMFFIPGQEFARRALTLRSDGYQVMDLLEISDEDKLNPEPELPQDALLIKLSLEALRKGRIHKARKKA